MNNDQFNQYDAERFHLKVAAELGISVDELKTQVWAAPDRQTSCFIVHRGQAPLPQTNPNLGARRLVWAAFRTKRKPRI